MIPDYANNGISGLAESLTPRQWRHPEPEPPNGSGDGSGQ